MDVGKIVKTAKSKVRKAKTRATTRVAKLREKHRGTIGKAQKLAGNALAIRAGRRLDARGAYRGQALAMKGEKNIRKATAQQKARGMSRSQAARIAARARWHGGGKKK